MKAQVNRNTEFVETNTVVVIIGNNRFTLKETIDGRLQINKISLNDENYNILVAPRVGNEIEVF
jgi:hypothetical protein